MPGTQKNAETAVTINMLMDWSDWRFTLPHDADGWKYLGSGWARHAFLGPDNVVYKVPTQESGSHDASRSEVANCARLRGTALNRGWDVPAADLFDVDGEPVVGMEFIPDNVVGDYWQDTGWIRKEWGLEDIHHNNVRSLNGINYVIDLGEDGS